jgi:hypothetical protein
MICLRILPVGYALLLCSLVAGLGWGLGVAKLQPEFLGTAS